MMTSRATQELLAAIYEKVRVHMTVVPRSTMNTNGGTENEL